MATDPFTASIQAVRRLEAELRDLDRDPGLSLDVHELLRDLWRLRSAYESRQAVLVAGAAAGERELPPSA